LVTSVCYIVYTSFKQIYIIVLGLTKPSFTELQERQQILCTCWWT